MILQYFMMTLTAITLTGVLAAGCSEQTTAPQSAAPPASPAAPAAVPMHMESKIGVYQDLLKKDPQNLDALVGLGNVLMDNARYSEAVHAYDKALKITPDNADVRVDMGTCYRGMGRPENAAEEYRKALTYQPNHINGLTNLGVVLAYDLNDFDGAAKAWEQVLAIAPNHQKAAQMRQEIERFKSLAKQAPESKKNSP